MFKNLLNTQVTLPQLCKPDLSSLPSPKMMYIAFHHPEEELGINLHQLNAEWTIPIRQLMIFLLTQLF